MSVSSDLVQMLLFDRSGAIDHNPGDWRREQGKGRAGERNSGAGRAALMSGQACDCV